MGRSTKRMKVHVPSRHRRQTLAATFVRCPCRSRSSSSKRTGPRVLRVSAPPFKAELTLARPEGRAMRWAGPKLSWRWVMALVRAIPAGTGLLACQQRIEHGNAPRQPRHRLARALGQGAIALGSDGFDQPDLEASQILCRKRSLAFALLCACH